MGHLPLIDELAIIAVVAVAVTVVLSRFRLPTVAGLLLAGALLGPYGFRLTHSIDAIEVLAEIGVVLLLFTIGLEFSLTRLKNILRQVALGGVLQIGLTIGAAVAVGLLLNQSLSRGLFYGFVFALSSTAIVLRALAERGELDAPHGRFIVGTLIFQDLCVVPMVLIVPFLSPQQAAQGGAAMAVSLAIGKAAAVVVVSIVVARLVVPRALARVDQSRSREVFLLAILALCIGGAWLTSLAGLSPALGAFLGGMLVADTEYGHRAMGDVMPLRDAFVSVFFVSLGMLFDPYTVMGQPLLVGGLLLGFIGAKGLLATLAASAMRFPRRAAWLAGAGLAQFGEFGFVLARLGEQHHVVSADETRPLLAAGIASMFLTPMLVRVAPHIRAGEVLLAPLERLIGVRSIAEVPDAKEALERHVVIVGFGLAGRFAARSLKACNIPYVVLELNAETVRNARAQGLPLYYGDATSPEALAHAHLKHATALVLLMNDPTAAQRVVDTARRVAPDVPILMRTRYLLEREPLVRLGARDVVAEEVEGAVEIISRMLRWIEVPRNVIDERLKDVRNETQSSDRKLTLPRPALSETRALDEMKIESFLVREGMRSAGKSAVQLELRRTTGALVVGVKRGDKLLENPDPTVAFEPGDTVFLVGTGDAVRAAIDALGAEGSETAQGEPVEP
ncbi:MAG: cation:proton antiporter [Archangiaceae bacterium]|nr:cation:proton antiporter [Archangiaceae bacterium]